MRTDWTQIRPDETLGLIWIHCVGFLKDYFGKVDFETKISIQYNTNLLAYQQNTMPLAIYNTKQYDIHLLSLL